jgi:hypothetical protein
MRFFYDTEFLEDGKTIDLISIGIVREDGAEYYAVNADADWERILDDEWLVKHVVSQLAHPITYLPKWKIAMQVRDFLLSGETPPQLWAWYAAYDHVALAQLFGKMIDLPEGIPMYTNDLKQVVGLRGLKGLPEQAAGEHNALADAHHARAMFEWIWQATGSQALVGRTAG